MKNDILAYIVLLLLFSLFFTVFFGFTLKALVGGFIFKRLIDSIESR